MMKNSFDAEDLEHPIKKDAEFVDYFFGGQYAWNDLYINFAPNEITYVDRFGTKSNKY